MLQKPMTASLSPQLLDTAFQDHEDSSYLIQRLANADRAAFAQLVLCYQDPLINYLTKLANCRAKAEDIAQESFVKLYRAVQKSPDRQWHIRAYLYRIAINMFCSQERRQKHFGKLKHLLKPHLKETHGDQLLRNEAQDQVQKAIARLPVRYRVPLVMREIEGWRLIDIANCLNINEGTVKSRIFRGKQKLKDLLEDYWRGARK